MKELQRRQSQDLPNEFDAEEDTRIDTRPVHESRPPPRPSEQSFDDPAEKTIVEDIRLESS